jgi:hypothetical protein
MIERLYLQSLRPEAAPLRVGVFLDSLEVIPAFGAVLDHLKAASFVDLSLLILHDAELVDPPPPPAWAALLPRKLRNALRPDIQPKLLYDLYEQFDQRMNAETARSLNLVDYSAKLAQTPRISVRPITKRFVHRFPAEAVEQIKNHNLDVILRFGFNILRGAVLNSATHGVWSYHHGDNDEYRGGPAHFWEMQERNPLSGVMLQVLTEDLDAGHVLTKALAPTLSYFSVTQNRVSPYASGHSFVIRKLWELHSYGPEHLREHAVAQAPYRGKKAIYRHPSNLEMLGFLPRFATVVKNRYGGGGDDIARWRIGLRATQPFPATQSPMDPRGFAWLEPPAGHFYADPFHLSRLQGGETQNWIFFEDYYGGRGRLAAAQLQPDGKLGDVHPVLDQPYHLSYPFLWQEAGELFMIPETGSNKTVELYRCTKFPSEWKLERVMFEGPAMDTTVLKHDGRLWFFLSLIDRPASAQLFLFSAKTLFDPWVYHPANPISLDIRTARCGGAFFPQNGKMVRVAQDGSRRYGYALRFLEIERLNDREYREREVSRLMPDQFDRGMLGVHTYNRSPAIELIDGQRREPKRNLS